MTFRGERFSIDLSEDDGDDAPPAAPFVPADITERTASAAAKPPPAPPCRDSASSSATGFPESRKRIAKSAFKRQRQDQKQKQKQEAGQMKPPQPRGTTSRNDEEEKRSIHEENARRLADMSPDQLASERDELVSSLAPSLLERFLRRANIDEDQSGFEEGGTRREQRASDAAAGVDAPTQMHTQEEEEEEEEDEEPLETRERSATSQPLDERPPAHPPADLFPASQPPSGPIHFPKPPPRDAPVPDLDPSSPSFLADLQSHYFPDTPHDPSSLSWMDPAATDAENPTTSAYHAQSTAESLTPSAIRFSLTGTILAPRTSLSLPTTLGLHHHGADPDAAGYTVPELAIFARSSLPAQRCLAWRVLGRLLFRLGRAEFGDRGSPLAEGLWGVVEHEGVVARMLAEASDDGGKDASGQAKAGGIGKHASAKAWATEAVWLWRRGGGGDRGLLKDGEVRSK